MAKKDSIPFLTPFFKARYPKITKPDTDGKFADGKFKTDGFLDDAEYEVVEATLKEAAKKLWPDQDEVSLPMKEFFTYADKEKKTGKKVEGRGFVLKSKYKPACFDAKKKKLPEGVTIGGGSVIRVAAAIFPWDKTTEAFEVDPKTKKKTKTQVTEYGLGLRLGDVQVRTLVAGGSQGTGDAFEEDEGGFEYGGEGDGSEQFGDDATAL